MITSFHNCLVLYPVNTWFYDSIVKFSTTQHHSELPTAFKRPAELSQALWVQQGLDAVLAQRCFPGLLWVQDSEHNCSFSSDIYPAANREGTCWPVLPTHDWPFFHSQILVERCSCHSWGNLIRNRLTDFTLVHLHWLQDVLLCVSQEVEEKKRHKQFSHFPTSVIVEKTFLFSSLITSDSLVGLQDPYCSSSDTNLTPGTAVGSRALQQGLRAGLAGLLWRKQGCRTSLGRCKHQLISFRELAKGRKKRIWVACSRSWLV